ncbi:MAG: hypothetical protein LAT62_06795, partial [Natronospirillum sp.]|uniref:hypothetical protein n=1 Tax=Natronospirillum sp. TaxID=2812955 RepID=UPI0025CF7B01
DRARDMVVQQGAAPDGRSLVLNQIPGPLSLTISDYSSTVWALTDQPGDPDAGFSGDGQLNVQFGGSSEADPAGLALFVDANFIPDLLIGATSVFDDNWAVALHEPLTGALLDSENEVLTEALLGPGDTGTAHAATGAAQWGFVMGWRTVGGNDEGLVAAYSGGSNAVPNGTILGGTFPGIPGGLGLQSRALDGTVLLEQSGFDFVANLITLVHYFQWDGDEQVSHQTHLVRISEESTAENTAVLSDLDGERPLAVSQFRITNEEGSGPEDSLILVATLTPDNTIRVSAYEVDTASGIEILADAVWDIAVDGLQTNDLNDIALSETLFTDPLTRHIYVGGSTASGQPLLVALDPSDGLEHQRWSGRDLGLKAYGHVVSAQPVTPIYEQPDFFIEPVTHLQVLIDAYVDGRWQSLVKRIPFVALVD